MEIREITLDENQSEKYLPPTSRLLLALGETRVVSAIEGEEIEALALLSKPDGGEGLILNHLWVKEGKEESLLPLISHVRGICVSMGIVRLNCRFIDSREGIQRIHALMDMIPHKPLMLNGHRLSYKMTGLDVDAITAKFRNLLPLLRQVKTYPQIHRLQYNKFYEKMRQIGRPPYADTRDEVFDRYFEYRGGISGYINTTRTTMEVLLIADSFVYDKEIRQYAFPAMLTSLLMEAKAQMPPEGRLILQVYEEHLYSGVTTMLGEPGNEDIITEYILL